MGKRVALRSILKEVVNEKGMEFNESLELGLRRKFDRLIENLGGNKELLKAGGHTISFDKTEVPFMKALVKQLNDENGLVSNFANKKDGISSSEIRLLIQSILDEEDKAGAGENELRQLAAFLDRLFCCGLLYTIENCHAMIDLLALNLQDLLSDEQVKHFVKVEHLLKKEVSLRISESAIKCLELADIIEISKNFDCDSIGGQGYSNLDPEVRGEYLRRDRQVLRKIQEDEGLRAYIEGRIGKRAEEIFNYAFIED